MAKPYQDNRSVAVTTPFGAGAVLINALQGSERVSRPFQFDLTLHSERADLNADDILGKAVTVTLTLPDQSKRYCSGLVSEFAQSGWAQGLHQYQAVIRPWFWFLTHTTDCRVFQNQSVTDIYAAVCRGAGFSDYELRLEESKYEKREYCVQYRESDFQFLSRLLEQAGIFYYFEHSDGKHKMVLTDEIARLTSVSGYDKVPFYPQSKDVRQRERDHLQSWSVQKFLQPGKYATRDYDFENPTAQLAAASSISRKHDAAKFEVFEFPSHAAKLTAGSIDTVAKVRAEELQTAQALARGAGDAAGLAAGRLFTLAKHPADSNNIRYLCTASELRLSTGAYRSGALAGADTELEIAIEAVDSREPYRPARLTPKPLIQGLQTALVVGGAEDEILTDKYGRVKVQFRWDRYGKKDASSSCWVRVAHAWAGKNWGAVQIPRIGQEVVVSFLEGDPDCPLIIGSVYNNDQMPPYALPANMTQSGLKSRSSKEGTSDTFNEIRFEDKKGSEEVYIHAEKNLTVVIENNQTISIGADKKDKGDRTVTIQNDEQLTVGNDRTEEVKHDAKLTVGNDRTTTVKHDDSLTVSNNLDAKITGKETRSVGADRATDVKSNDDLKVSSKYSLTAGDQITLEVGQAKIVMKSDGSIQISGSQLQLKGTSSVDIDAAQTKVSGTQLDVKGTKTTVDGSGTLDLSSSGVASLKGSLTKIG
ncbi:MAG TPA: type VI secretion system tip protein TssI/VgrG [Steroidobacteraceae bacterium]|nr:type VI secretion system tip protein TssI/VgrG [Steroidobacteraceae bacterium]